MDRDMVKTITIVFGVVYFLVGVMGFIPGITPAANVTGMNTPGEGLELGLFGVNLMHNIAHLIFGIILVGGALAGGQALYMANRVMFVVFVVLIVAHFIMPVANMMAMNTADLFLHIVSALLTGYLGFVATREGRLVRS